MSQHEGLDLMQVEMARQCHDALATLEGARAPAERIAAAAREAGELVLYGIGGSHHVDRMVEPLYREAGIACRALSPSEALMAPLPPGRRAALFVSQSGESGEIVELLARPAAGERRFGLTLNADSTLGRRVETAVVAEGGPENAFAATRSIVLTVAMHAAVLRALGLDSGPLEAVLAADSPADMDAVDALIAPCDLVVFAGRHVFQGAAASAALSLMELSRMPAIGFESGQFRHGPFEFLRPGLGIVLMRGAGPDRDSIPPIAAATLAAGCSTVVLDASGAAPVAGALTVALARNEGLAAATQMLLSLQRLNIAVARRRIPRGIGTPLYTSKVTV